MRGIRIIEEHIYHFGKKIVIYLTFLFLAFHFWPLISKSMTLLLCAINFIFSYVIISFKNIKQEFRQFIIKSLWGEEYRRLGCRCGFYPFSICG